jgi:hypothetical protein
MASMMARKTKPTKQTDDPKYFKPRKDEME